MTGKEAIAYVYEHFGVVSKYALAKALSTDTLNVQTIQISNYLKGTKMSQKVADRFDVVYGIIITDAYNPTDFAEVVKAINHEES